MIRRLLLPVGAVCSALVAVIAPPIASAGAILEDFELSQQIDIGSNPQSILSLIQVNPVPNSPDTTLVGIDVNVLVSYGTIGTFEGMFFEFINLSSAPNSSSVVTSIMFQTEGLLATPNYTAWSGTQVGYTIGGEVPDGGFSIEFNDELNADANNPQPKNGIGFGEHFLVGYTIDSNSGYTYQSLLENLLIGGPDDYNGWTIAAHLQRTTGGTSTNPIESAWLASYTDNQTSPFPPDGGVVPIPGAASLGLLGFGLIAAARRKTRK